MSTPWLSDPLTRRDETHMFDVNITCCRVQRKIEDSNWSSSTIERTWLLMCSIIESVIEIYKEFNMGWLWRDASWLVANNCMEVLKLDNSSIEWKEFVLVVRRYEYSRLAEAF